MINVFICLHESVLITVVIVCRGFLQNVSFRKFYFTVNVSGAHTYYTYKLLPIGHSVTTIPYKFNPNNDDMLPGYFRVTSNDIDIIFNLNAPIINKQK